MRFVSMSLIPPDGRMLSTNREFARAMDLLPLASDISPRLHMPHRRLDCLLGWFTAHGHRCLPHGAPSAVPTSEPRRHTHPWCYLFWTHVPQTDLYQRLVCYFFWLPMYQRVIPSFTFRAADDTTGFTNQLFDFRSNTDWTNVNTGETNQSLYVSSSEGFYKVAVELLGRSSQGNFNFVRVLFDYTLCLSVQSSPDTQPAFTYSYRVKPANTTPSVNVNFLALPVQSQPVFLRFDNQASGETFSNVVVRVTKMNYWGGDPKASCYIGGSSQSACFFGIE